MKIRRGGKHYRFTIREAGNARKARRGKVVRRRVGYNGGPASGRHPGGNPWASGRDRQKKAQ